MRLESRCEQIVEVDLISLVDARDGDGASVTLLAGASGSTLLLLFAIFLDGVTSLGSHVD